MVNGPDNALAAEDLIADARTVHAQDGDIEHAALLMAEAQVRATLALALASVHGSLSEQTRGNWNAVAR